MLTSIQRYLLPNDIVKTGDECVGIARRALERVPEVVRLLVFRKLDMSRKSAKARERDEEQYDNLERAKRVLQPKSPLEEHAVHDERKCDASDADPTLVPLCHLLPRSE